MDGNLVGWIQWPIAVAALVGVILNIKKRRLCFIVWFTTNVAWAIVDWGAGLHAQAALFAVYAGLAVYGWICWGERTGGGE